MHPVMVNNFGWVHDVLEAAVCQDGMLGKIIPAAVSHSLNSFCGMASNLLLILAHEAQISSSVDKWRSWYLVKLLTVVQLLWLIIFPLVLLAILAEKNIFTFLQREQNLHPASPFMDKANLWAPPSMMKRPNLA